MRVRIPTTTALQAAVLLYEQVHTHDPALVASTANRPRACEECVAIGKAMALSRLFTDRQQSMFRELLFLIAGFQEGAVSRAELEQHQIMMMKISLSYGLYASAIMEDDKV